jgi:glycolate oxidase
MDGTIPRKAIAAVLKEIAVLSERYGRPVVNVFHAGDGNLHPLIVFDKRDPGELERTIAAGADILRACVTEGGSISGEHGIGLEKRDCMSLQFSADDLEYMMRLKSAFNPRGLCNPGKVFPTSRRCGEATHLLQAGRVPPAVAAAGEPF